MREQVQWFAGRMESKLKENDHKGGWDGCGIFWLRNRLVEEVNELSDAMDAGHNSESGLDLNNIICEAADVANFAMMIADKARKRLTGGVSPMREVLVGSGYSAEEVKAMSDEECRAEWDELCSQYTS
ncbi:MULTISPECIES: hypothetical protein [Bacillales]|uniref:hypothetical protein n=1 Tax=Bacillales TaxID=1385 RepID=UPI00034D7757|nr:MULTISPECIES: hypothetical protein [Bacillales]